MIPSSVRNQQNNQCGGVAVIIPTRNGDRWLERLLVMLHRQTLQADEILLVDSGSTDSTSAIARRHNVRFIRIPPESFDHGGTRNFAAGKVDADILVYMTQDAIPADEFALARLVYPFFENEKIAVCYGRQLPDPDADPFAEHLRLFNYPARSHVYFLRDRRRYGFKTIFISNSFAAYRKKILEKCGFFPDKQIFGEDSCAVAVLLKQGYGINYVSNACVYHSHNYSIREEFQRYFDIGVFHSFRSDLLAEFGTPQKTGNRFVRSEFAFLWERKKYQLLPVSLLRSCVKFVAYQLGKRYRILPESISKRLSMHSNWWS